MGHHHHHGHSHHGHCHGHHHGSDNIGLAFFLNLVFTIIEFVGGFLTGSHAILADGIHDLGDTATIGIAWFLEKKSKKQSDDFYSYGYARLSLLASLITAFILLAGSLAIVVTSIPRLLDPQPPETLGVIALAFLGVAVNGYAFLKIIGDSSHNSKMIKWHLFEDAAGWIVVLIGGVIMHFTDWYIIDPLLAIILSVYISYNVVKGLKEVIQILLQKTPQNMDRETIRKNLIELEGVTDITRIHAWSLDHSKVVVTCNAVLSEGSDAVEVKKGIRSKLAELGNVQVTVEVEYAKENS